MKIAVLGAGAMGSLFGGYLSRHNEVWLVDVNAARIQAIQENGVTIREKDGEVVLRPQAVTGAAGLDAMDLVIVFVKAMFTLEALSQNRRLVGKNTCLMTLQNGSGHENRLLQFSDPAHVIIGTTQHNSSIIADGRINHGGGGKTSIGLLGGNSTSLQPLADNFTRCGFETTISHNIKQQIWNKLFLNTSASSLTAILQVPLGFILDDPHACSLMEGLAREAVAVANAEGAAVFDPEEVINNIKTVLANARGGYTSIYADIKNGVKTEVDTISGSVVESARRLGVPAPYHQFVVSMIHALENRVKTTD